MKWEFQIFLLKMVSKIIVFNWTYSNKSFFFKESANNIAVANASNDRYARSLEDLLEDDRKIEITPADSPTGLSSPAERKKSIVHFNEMVERIDFSKENEA